MSANITFPDVTLEQLVSNIRLSRKLTRQDQRLLMQFGSQFGFSSPQTNLLDQVYDALRRGTIRVVD